MKTLPMPLMRHLRQHFEVPAAIDVSAEFALQWQDLRQTLALTPGMRVAVGVGSRGIANLPRLVCTVIDALREAGARPFVTPAMGSHGGATPEGQMEVLRIRGITESSVGAPIRAGMETVSMGEVDGIPLFLDRLAAEAEGIVLINRVKPHTNFIGDTESGIMKMIAIGLGNQVGAEHYHRLSVVRDQYTIISTAGRELLKRANFLFGVCLVENQDHRTCELALLPPQSIEAGESRLLRKAKAILPTLPLQEIDLLIVDEMGKDISGEGIDPNVVGRDVCAYGVDRPSPEITRIYVRDLTAATEGSALGIGQADFTTQRLVEKIDFPVTAINCLTACCPEAGKVPLAYASDREALAAAFMSIRPFTPNDLRLVHIRNTLNLNTLLVSEGCLEQLTGDRDLEPGREAFAYDFDQNGDLRVPCRLG